MGKLGKIISLCAAFLVVSACAPAYESEGDRLQRVGEQSLEGIQTSGLENLE
jgi:hypothetical protein